MKIAYFTDTYYPEINGVVTSIKIFSTKLREQGVDLTIYAPYYPKGSSQEEDEEENVRRMMSFTPPMAAMRFQRLSYPWLNDKKTFWAFIKEIKAEKYDLMHIQVQGSMGLIGLLVSRICNIPAVHTYHTMFIEYVHYVPDFLHWAGRRAVKWLSRLYANRCEITICPSEEIKTELLSYNVRNNMEVIPTGLDCASLYHPLDLENLRDSLGIKKNQRVLGFVGRLAEEKNIEFLLDICLSLRQSRQDFCFLIVGGGPHAEVLQAEAARLGIMDFTIFTGFIAPERVKNYYKLMDLFVFSSETETQGLCVLEAMSQGVPYVAVDAMGVSSIIEGGLAGIGVAPDDKEAFLKAVNLLLDDKELYAKKAKETIERISDFDCSEPVLKMMEIYKKAIKQHRQRFLSKT